MDHRKTSTGHCSGEAALAGHPARMQKSGGGIVSDLRSVSRLVIDAVAGVTHIVEDMHRNIAALSPIIGASPTGRARGVSGLVYRSIGGVTHAVGFALNTGLSLLAPFEGSQESSPRREAALAALNGLVGDYLVASNNPLAIPMCLRRKGQQLVLERQSLAKQVAHPKNKLLVMVHGLCMSDLEWKRDEHDHGHSLEQDLGYTSIYLHYNSGRHVSQNGREFAAIMERLTQEWPVPVTEIALVGHSMGGLVSRSACHHAIHAKDSWIRHLKKLICLGTPHHGTPLERIGNGLNLLLKIGPYTAPFARLGDIRSAGIRDLRYGNTLDGDGEARGGSRDCDRRKWVQLPDEVQCFLIAATKQSRSKGEAVSLEGDGLVPVRSALGQHRNPNLTLNISASHKRICYASNHFDLLSSQEVYDQLRSWLAKS